MAELEALIFDVDGTLADTERDGHRVAFNRAFETSGLDWEWSVTLYGKLLAVTGGKERIRHYLDHYNPDYPRPDDLDGFIAALHASKTEHYTRMLSQGLIPMRNGVKRLLQEARQAGLRLAIATTTTPANVSALLQHSLSPDAESWFEVIAAGDIVAAKKPAPDIYLWAMQQMGLPADACLAFEDSHNGVQSAQRAAIDSILVTTNGYTDEDDFSGATLVIDQFGEPDQPFQVKSGTANGHNYVDIALLQTLHGRSDR
ncbi:MAG: phosphatase [gamma proteobacterium symbiont of Ctena orbiculata]|uniref:HAD family hydrolase n=1 Tax=Candidatus Thiodiazotropha taylori TaxID=2792791 RepID=A0A944QTL0_9GAMM|nr:HAD family hydrolase [Candidatus Thiodiazotropha taylori]PUB84954.1 MAG: phosphatase [gamma proteobacterium symbiont of Ctena orbiculata]MBT3028466.1 HAD family hydrolase [Candidatus Thiodiazotropha taylori]MBT3036431.1 HAD family hydrolase [Candidatus Thiodiazotropha taylori]MBV2138130.1 HAD family hydrolase [Candidatus Thiodiazotropha taylori]